MNLRYVELLPRQHHSSGPPVAMSGTKATGGPSVARRRQSEGGICHWWTTGGPPPANNVASGPPAISWTSVWWATTANWWHSVVGHRWPTITLLSGTLLNKSVYSVQFKRKWNLSSIEYNLHKVGPHILWANSVLLCLPLSILRLWFEHLND